MSPSPDRSMEIEHPTHRPDQSIPQRQRFHRDLLLSLHVLGPPRLGFNFWGQPSLLGSALDYHFWGQP